MKIVVIGAGLVGLCSAYFLQRQGASITIVEREKAPGLGTSYANGGLLHPSLVDPWNGPGVLGLALRSLGREGSALLVRPKALPSLFTWGWRFLRESSPARFRMNAARNLALARYSLTQMKDLRADTSLNYHQSFRGSISLFRDSAAALEARRRADDLGLLVRWLDRDALVALEPQLIDVAQDYKASVHYLEDEAGDAQKFCVELAELLRRRGAEFRYSAEVSGFDTERDSVHALRLGKERMPGDAFVLCAGVWSSATAANLRIHLPVRPAKGYSVTMPRSEAAPLMPVIDHALHVAIVPVGANGLRIAGTAEFAGFDLSVNPARVANLQQQVSRIFPRFAADLSQSSIRAWAGLRPMCVDGVPLIGRTRWSNVFVNTGHGHLGWTLAAGSGRLLCDLVTQQQPEIEAQDYRIDRF